MVKKYYTFSSYRFDEVACFSTDEIYYRLLCENYSEVKAKAIANLVETMSPVDYLMFDNDGATCITIRCWTYESD